MSPLNQLEISQGIPATDVTNGAATPTVGRGHGRRKNLTTVEQLLNRKDDPQTLGSDCSESLCFDVFEVFDEEESA